MFDFNPISVVKMNEELSGKFKKSFMVDGFVYIGRGSPLGNTYSCKDTKFSGITMVDSSEEAIDSFEHDLYHWKLESVVYETLDLIHEQRMNHPITLVCFCKPNKCHGDVIRRYLEVMYD